MKSITAIALTLATTFALTGPALAGGDAAAGEDLYVKKCKMCHTTAPGKHGMGPSLAGMMGSKAGTAEGFTKYLGLKDNGTVWDATTMDTFLADPKAFVGGGKSMAVKVTKADERANLIAYMETLK